MLYFLYSYFLSYGDPLCPSYTFAFSPTMSSVGTKFCRAEKSVPCWSQPDQTLLSKETVFKYNSNLHNSELAINNTKKTKSAGAKSQVSYPSKQFPHAPVALQI